METQSTVYKTRAEAIKRIQHIYKLIRDKEYDELNKNTNEEITFEEFKEDMFVFSDDFEYQCFDYLEVFKFARDGSINNLDDEALSDFLSFPFFRFSMYENYCIDNPYIEIKR